MTSPRRRDPEGRQLAMREAAARIVATQGRSALTHRAVAARAGVSLGSTTRYFSSIDDLYAAALNVLVAELEASLAEIERELAAADDAWIDRCAALVHGWLSDTEESRSVVALVAAAISDPALREIALRWTAQASAAFGRRVGAEAGLAIATYIDGATMHAALHETPIAQADVARVLTALAGAHD